MSVRITRGPIVIDGDAFGADIVTVSGLSTLDEPVIVGRRAFIRFRTEPGPAPWRSNHYAGRDSVAFSGWSSRASADMALRVNSNTSSQSGGPSRS